jgi:23S rRNA (cytosine1962-C5)-methyltransferase
VTADVFEALADHAARQEVHDLVVLDPPAFAPNRKSVPQALGAYRRLAEAGARVTAPHGVLVAASCSAHVSLEEFMGAVEEGLSAARRSGRTLRIAGQPPDHPAPLTCPELRYLKVVFVQLAD